MELRQRGPADVPGVLAPASRGYVCSSVTLPMGGVLIIPGSDPITLTAPGAYRPACTQSNQPAIIAGNGGPGSFTELTELAGGAGINVDTDTGEMGPQLSDLRDPFYASTFVVCYALAATTIIAYTLVIMLFITPRSFLDGGVVVLGRRGFTHGGSGGQNIGGRPWLQKVAALTVAISMTIATADTFREAEEQYSYGFQNAAVLQTHVLGGTQLKIIRLVSDTFLWLAQAQTLIRLFPRQREKIIIKWTAFSLITLDIIFDSLNSFLYSSAGRTFTDAIPALSYLFQLSLGVLYAAWVIYYSLMKKKYAFYHKKMRNMLLVATLSIISLLVPVVFFVLDISKPDVTGWGDYVRWVGAAAASVIVWEWVERIEALEREEKKDGILGREVFDGDEMMEISGSEFTWPRKRKTRKTGEDDESGGFDDGGEGGGVPPQTQRVNWARVTSITNRFGSRPKTGAKEHASSGATGTEVHGAPRSAARSLQPPLWPSRPPVAVTPVSRTDTASADSTVYQVRFAPPTDSTSRTDGATPQPPLSRSNSAASSRPRQGAAVDAAPTSPPADSVSAKRWRALAQAMPFRRGPPESDATAGTSSHRRQHEESTKWDLRSRLEDFAVSQAERLREKIRPTVDTANLPVRVIPAPARRGTALAQVLEEEEQAQALAAARASQGTDDDATGSSQTAAATFPDPGTLILGRGVSNPSRATTAPAAAGCPPIIVETASRRPSLDREPARPGAESPPRNPPDPPGPSRPP